MKIYLANSSRQAIGGGWSWISNMKKAMPEVVDSYDDADVYLIPSPSMIQREEFAQAKADGKKIVLRIDNAVRNSRNRNTGMSRMLDFAHGADLVVYQSKWARDYLLPFTEVEGTVILNSVDETIFNAEGRDAIPQSYLYSRFNRDETKNWEMARYWYYEIQQEHPDASLNIIGQFSDELREGNFDFFCDENYTYLGIISDPRHLAKLYKRTQFLIYSYFNDACSNTLIEALMCGCDIYDNIGMSFTGGAKDIYEKVTQYGIDYFKLQRMADEYRVAIKAIL